MSWTLVTGGAKGLGAEICKTLAHHGFDVLVHYRESQKEANTVKEHCLKLGSKALLIHADFSTLEGIETLLNTLQDRKLSVKNLVNNVGNFIMRPLKGMTANEWLNLFQINLHAPFVLTKGLFHEIKSHRGNIINIGTVGSHRLPNDPKYAAYMLTKNALHQLTKAFAKECAKEGVRVNMVSPGEMENSVTLEAHLSKLPMKRAATKREVADVILFLLSNKASYITGQNIEIAGGFAL